ncbi:RsmB/NOP family class I SAM-dependent RNA methyltransferase [Polycladidibacter stylochi]|uniref:RsmB/NOP family class I SAM-dependent RNA methyltransferase n=1 Tax=Polycladidibacter stylochi TaxID=1807766 RepID=UPI0009E75252|nr:RsmB/NOP family class I SAM-dependent RNA methyltransferase [Pseudovibrio stylochi]
MTAPKRSAQKRKTNTPHKKAEPKQTPQSLPGYFPRKVATDLLGKVLTKRMPLDGELDLQNGHPGYKKLEPADRALARAIIGTVLRRRGQIQNVLDTMLERPIPEKTGRALDILHIACAQILFMAVADHAAVSLAVELAGADSRARPYKGLINAVLRRVTREGQSIVEQQDETVLNAPEWMFARWTNAYGLENAKAIATAHLNEPYLDITLKAGQPELLDELQKEMNCERSLGSSLRMQPKGGVEKLPRFDDGIWWVQDSAAAVPARLLGNIDGKNVADLCAAPGGKTMQLASMGANVTAVDISARRLQRLEQNCKRMDLSVATITCDLKDYQPNQKFDAILLDAPCSATGTIRRHPDVAWLKREADVEKLAELQYEILEKTSNWLSPGGLLVYCTCSLELEEGELQIQRFLLENPQFSRVPVTTEELNGCSEAITAQGDFRALPCHNKMKDPHLSGLDGFYAARLRFTQN